jgi:hypothetical protein
MESEKYFVSTVGLEEGTIRAYIQAQEEEDFPLDERNLFDEYAPPVGGANFNLL